MPRHHITTSAWSRFNQYRCLVKILAFALHMNGFISYSIVWPSVETFVITVNRTSSLRFQFFFKCLVLLRLVGSFRFHELLCNILFGKSKSKCWNRKYHLLDLLQGVVVDMVQLFFVNRCVVCCEWNSANCVCDSAVVCSKWNAQMSIVLQCIPCLVINISKIIQRSEWVLCVCL